MTEHLPSSSWSTFVSSDAAKVATFIAICGLLVVGLQPAGAGVRFAQFCCSAIALCFVAVLAYRDRT